MSGEQPSEGGGHSPEELYTEVQHQNRGGGGAGGGGGGRAAGPTVGQKRAPSECELDTHQKQLRKQLQNKLLKTSKAKPNQKTKQAVIDQAARGLEIVWASRDNYSQRASDLSIPHLIYHTLL
jgi:hypothetical protein